MLFILASHMPGMMTMMMMMTTMTYHYLLRTYYAPGLSLLNYKMGLVLPT